MRRFANLLLTTTALTFCVIGVASAADLRARPAPAPMPPPAPVWNWTGFYIGGHAGGGWGGGGNGDGAFVGGGQIGYNFQLAPNWIIGVEGDFSGTSFKETETFAFPNIAATATVNGNLNWLASVRGRIGYTYSNWMVYFTGGGAWADLEADATAFSPVLGTATASASATASGWVLGGGAEWMFAPNWTFGVEYLHYDFDHVSGTANFPSSTVFFDFESNTRSVDVVRARLNYKFGDWFGPTVYR